MQATRVIVFSTDTEVDKTYFDALRPLVSNTYRMEYDMADRCKAAHAWVLFRKAET